jgi:hypothetical protein
MLNQIINLGAFTKATADIINNNFNTVAQASGLGPGKVWFVNANGGGGDGTSWDQAFGRMADAFAQLSSNDTIFFVGQIREELIAPLGVSNVRIIGAGTRPRYGNESSFSDPSMDAASAWRPPVVPTALTSLLVIRQQGWVFQNILFDCPVDASAVKMWRNEDAVHPDPSSASFIGCQFSDGKYGIEDKGGCYNIYITGCSFRRLSNMAIWNSGGAGLIALPLDWVVEGNIFEDCDGGIAEALSNGVVQNNIFINGVTYHYANGKITTTGGVRNFLINNYTFDVAADVDPAHGYTGVATDVWRTFPSDTADPVVVSPPS